MIQKPTVNLSKLFHIVTSILGILTYLAILIAAYLIGNGLASI